MGREGNPRSGARGGAAEFKWTDVAGDKDRENFLGHSINAPVGRWQKNKDIHWYNKDVSDDAESRAAEVQRIKQAEEDAMSLALGYKPTVKAEEEDPEEKARRKAEEKALKRIDKEERRARKEERRSKREERHQSRRERSPRSRDDREDEHRRRRRDRSASPRREHRRHQDRDRERERDYRRS